MRGARATVVVAAATRRALYYVYNTTEPRERVVPRVGGELIKIAAAAACEQKSSLRRRLPISAALSLFFFAFSRSSPRHDNNIIFHTLQYVALLYIICARVVYDMLARCSVHTAAHNAATGT